MVRTGVTRVGEHALGISPSFVAASARVPPPSWFGSSAEAIWSGRGFEGMSLGSAADAGTWSSVRLDLSVPYMARSHRGAILRHIKEVSAAVRS